MPIRVPRRYLYARTHRQPLVISVVTPSLNQGAFIGQTIKSLAYQRYYYLEYTLQDGGSSDSTLEVVERLCDQVAIINRGKVVVQGTMAELRQHAAEGISTLEDIFVSIVGAERYSEKLDWL